MGVDKEILNKAGSITDEEITNAIEKQFPGDLYRNLRTWLSDALKVKPLERWSLDNLIHHHSLFGKMSATLNVTSVATAITGAVSRMDSHNNKILEKVWMN